MGSASTRTDETNDSTDTDSYAGRVVVYLGNRKAVEVLEDPDDVDAAAQENRAPNRLRQALPGKRCTTIVLAPGTPLMQAAYEITHLTQGVWQAHSDADTPAWVVSTSPALAALLAEHYRCELREPDPSDGAAVTADEDGDG